jgi:hypothetical protein
MGVFPRRRRRSTRREFVSAGIGGSWGGEKLIFMLESGLGIAEQGFDELVLGSERDGHHRRRGLNIS